MRFHVSGLVTFALALACAGCGATFADPLGKENSLDEAQKRYTQLVRWGEMERASEFVDPALRQDFLVFGPQLENVKITDYESGDIEMDDGDSAKVTVTYRAYSMATFVEKPIREKQLWYRESGLDNTWYVRSTLPEQISEIEAP